MFLSFISAIVSGRQRNARHGHKKSVMNMMNDSWEQICRRSVRSSNHSSNDNFARNVRFVQKKQEEWDNEYEDDSRKDLEKKGQEENRAQISNVTKQELQGLNHQLSLIRDFLKHSRVFATTEQLNKLKSSIPA